MGHGVATGAGLSDVAEAVMAWPGLGASDWEGRELRTHPATLGTKALLAVQ